MSNWATFLPLAHEGLGRLLLQIAAVPETGLTGDQGAAGLYGSGKFACESAR